MSYTRNPSVTINIVKESSVEGGETSEAVEIVIYV
jgi:hypothetical protein